MSDYQRCQEQPSHRTKVEERSCFPAQVRTETNPLMGLPNAQLFPHAASRTAAAQRAMSWVVRDVWNVLDVDPK